MGPLLRIAEGQSCDVSSINNNQYSTHLAIQQSDPYADVLVSRRAPAGGGGRGAAGLVEPAAAVETSLAAPPVVTIDDVPQLI